MRIYNEMDWNNGDIHVTDFRRIQVLHPEKETKHRCLVYDFNLTQPPGVSSLIKYVTEYFHPPSTPFSLLTDRPPLFFQHAGHSRTIIGIEHLTSGETNFLVFDPSKCPSGKAKRFIQSDGWRKAADVLSAYRVPVRELARRNLYQILR
jgi:Peptidase family C78